VDVVSSTALEITFSEKLSQLAGAVDLYEVIGLGAPSLVTLLSNQKIVRLQFSGSFVNGEQMSIRVNNITDRAGNAMIAVEKKFLFFEKHPTHFKDVIISELLPDPSPPAQLPEAEYIEIYNRSENPVDLQGWKLLDATGTCDLTSFILLPKRFVVLCSSTRNGLFSPGKTLGVISFPSLNNSGEPLTLKNEQGLLIDSVNYTTRWYHDTEKEDGGWSLEIIDPDNSCSEIENWHASESESGGTPGEQNSVYASKPDLTGPQLLEAFPLDENTLRLKFNEKLDKVLPGPENFILEPRHDVISVTFADGGLTEIQIKLSASMKGGVQYSVTQEKIYDCAGNLIQAEHNRAAFALPETAVPSDIVINEVLFNPRPTGVDFVELYNHSGKFINLNGWQLTNLENTASPKRISSHDLLFAPHTYLVLTENGNILKGEYLQGKEETFLEMDLPSLPDDEGSVVVVDADNNVLEEFVYSADFHSPLLQDDEGVSLERISVESNTSGSENWKSASSVSGFATPGFLNSNARDQTVSNEAIVIEPAIFVPQQGPQDFAQIRYAFERGGYIANVKIVDGQGREIKHVASNELLGAEGFFRWDGDQDNGSKARIGAYMVWFEIFDPNGAAKTFRKRVVVAGW
jgi:hypothetical protein